MKKVLGLLLALVLLVSLGTTVLAEGGEVENKTIYVIMKTRDTVFWQTVEKAALDVGKEMGFEVIVQSPAGGVQDLAGQIALCETAISTSPAGMVLAPIDMDALAPVCESAKEKGMVVSLFDCAINSDAYDVFYTTDNYHGAELLAEAVATRLGGKGKIGIINGNPGASAEVLREAGFVDYMKANYPEIELLETQYSGVDTIKAQNIALDMIMANPDIAAIHTCEPPSSLGVATALTEKGLNGKVLLTTFDYSSDTLPLIEDGTITAIMCQDAYNIGYQSTMAAIKIATGEMEPPAEKEQDGGSVLIDIDNMLEPEMQKLLYPLGK